MEILKFKVSVELIKGQTYSICMRGARRYTPNPRPNRADFEIFNPTEKPLKLGTWKLQPAYYATLVSQPQFLFSQLESGDCADNYNPKVRGPNSLYTAMVEVYPDFDGREVVTLLKFKIM